MPSQVRNDEMVAILSADLQRRYEPNFAWKSAISQYLALPALRGFWPMSAAHYTAASRALDLSGGGNHLTDNNTVDWGFENLIPYVEFNGVNQYFSRASAAGEWATVTGAESWIAAGQGGLTLGGWFKLGDLTDPDPLISKWTGTAASSSYLLYFRGDVANDPVQFYASDGAATDKSTLNFNATASDWWFLAGRWDYDDTTLTVFANADSADKVTTLGSLSDNATPFYIARMGSFYYTGKASLCFLCAASLSDTIVWSLFQQTRAMFNV